MNKMSFFRVIRYMGCVIFMMALCLTISVYFSPKPDLLEGLSFGNMVLDRKGSLIRISLSEDDKYRYYTPLSEIAPFAIQSLITYEDKYFFHHPGFNPFAIIRALILWPVTGRLPGASTISMQVARLRHGLKTSTPAGKLRQIFSALIIERHYSKEEILEAYFNLAPYGANIEGIEAAARIYFHKSANLLTESECIALTVIPQNPLKRRPDLTETFNKARHRLTDLLNAAHTEQINFHSVAELPFLAPHLTLELLKGGDRKIIKSFISPVLQKDLERIIKAYIERGARWNINNAAAMIVNIESMEVEALAGSANFFDNKIGGQIDGSNIRRSPGSTLKPFIYALALDQGLIHPMTILPDNPRSYGFYDPENFDHAFVGPISARKALKSSRNMPAIWLTEKLNHPDLYTFLQNADVKFTQRAEHYGLALTLGGAEVTMRELATLYAMLANGGVCRKLRFSAADLVDGGKRLLSPEAAWMTLDMLRDEDGMRNPAVYSKTGTSNGLRDAWTAGICGQYVIIVWVGNFNNESNPYFVGAKTALPLFEELVRNVANSRKLTDPLLEKPLKVAEISVCQETGDIAKGQCAATEKTYYIPGRSPIRDQGILRPVLIDKKSGLRACVYDALTTQEQWWEFWPSDMMAIFANAGIVKPEAPQWLPECQTRKTHGLGRDPEIKLPKKNVLYHRQLSQSQNQIPLMASADAEVSTLHWYADSHYLGSSRPEETILWNPERGGEVQIVVVDNLGRSKKRKCVIRTIP